MPLLLYVFCRGFRGSIYNVVSWFLFLLNASKLKYYALWLEAKMKTQTNGITVCEFRR